MTNGSDDHAGQPVFSATMVLADDSRRIGWLVVLALLAVATPVVLAVQHQSVSTQVLLGCIALGVVLGGGAAYLRATSAHQVRVDRRDDAKVLRVAGPRVRLEVVSPFSFKACRGEIVAHAGLRTMRLPVQVIVVEHAGVPVLALEVGASALASLHDWPAATGDELDYGRAPVFRQGLARVDLAALRRVLESA